MENMDRSGGIPALARISLVVIGAALGLTLALTVVLAQGEPNFDSSYKTGPLFADTDDVITYTVVAANTGEQVLDVVLSDTVPGGVTYIPGSCTYITETGGTAQSCGQLSQMWQEDFDGGDRITTTLAVTVTAGTMRWPLVNCAYLSWDTSQKEMCFTTTVNPSLLYLPLIMRNFTPKPDLQVTSLGVDPVSPTAGDPVTVTVEVENVGEKATESFWVDLYDDPSPPPTDANQLWSDVCSGPLEDCYGIAWYVDSGLDPGESVVLTSVGGYETEQSHWLGYFADSGSHDLYAFADSWNATVWFGGVLEHNEGVDNRAGPVTVNVGAGGGALGTSEDEEVSIPLRPNHP